MKKLIAVLFCTFVIAGCATTEKPLFEIDPVATANVPWKMNEVVYVYTASQDHQPLRIERRFLGMTSDGNYAVQDFYAQENLKYTDVFLMTSETAMFDVKDNVCYFESPHVILGAYMGWYRNGNKLCECFYEDGLLQGKVAYWYENGLKMIEGFRERDGDMPSRSRRVGVWSWWDIRGNLVPGPDQLINNQSQHQ